MTLVYKDYTLGTLFNVDGQLAHDPRLKKAYVKLYHSRSKKYGQSTILRNLEHEKLANEVRYNEQDRKYVEHQ